MCVCVKVLFNNEIGLLQKGVQLPIGCTDLRTGEKGTWQWEWPVTKRHITSKQIHVMWPNFAETYTHTNTPFHWSWLAPPLDFSHAPSISYQLFVTDA